MPRPVRNRVPRSLGTESPRPWRAALRRANAAHARAYPGESGERQPVHTVYGGAHLFRADSAARMGQQALEVLESFAPDGKTFAAAIGLRNLFELAGREDLLYSRVVHKLRREPIEDLRVDFEDGYGIRPDAEEDGHARSVASEMARGLAGATLPPFIGIRIKPLSEELCDRSLRTLDLFMSALVEATRGSLPPNFVVTVPKVTMPAHVVAVDRACALLERRLSLDPGALKLELMVETPQAILDATGAVALRALVDAGAGRVTAAHFGTYDYTALCGITAAHQQMQHAACDFAKHVMQVALAQTGIWLSDGSTNVLPVPPHRPPPGGTLSSSERRANRDAIHRAWKLHFDDVQHSLVNGFYQGWDLHAAQLPTRYAAVYAFFLAARPAASERLRSFMEKAEQATLVGDVFDDAATGQGLLNVFLRGINCGAITPEEMAETGLTMEEVRTGSFLRILAARRTNPAPGSRTLGGD